MLWQPTESVSVTIKALLHRIEADSTGDVVTPGAATVPDTGAAWFWPRPWDPMGTSQLAPPFGAPKARASISTPRQRTGSLEPLTGDSVTAWSEQIRFFYGDERDSGEWRLFPAMERCGRAPGPRTLYGRDTDALRNSSQGSCASSCRWGGKSKGCLAASSRARV